MSYEYRRRNMMDHYEKQIAAAQKRREECSPFDDEGYAAATAECEEAERALYRISRETVSINYNERQDMQSKQIYVKATRDFMYCAAQRQAGSRFHIANEKFFEPSNMKALHPDGQEDVALTERLTIEAAETVAARRRVGC